MPISMVEGPVTPEATSTRPPFATTREPAGRAPSAAIAKVPPSTVTSPVKVFAAFKVSVPAPRFTIPPQEGLPIVTAKGTGLLFLYPPQSICAVVFAAVYP